VNKGRIVIYVIGDLSLKSYLTTIMQRFLALFYKEYLKNRKTPFTYSFTVKKR